jgi:hypothetical protein
MNASIQIFQYSNQNDASKGQLEIKVVKKMDVMGSEITVTTQNGQDYICLTDMVKAKDGEFFISDWLRNRNTIEFLGIWETVYNAAFNHGEFAVIKNQAGLNSYKLSVKEWTRKTHAIGLQATVGRYGGTYAHKDIAFEFGMWISPKFKIYLIKEFQRLKDEESHATSLEWNFQRTLAKVNYKIHTDAIKEHLIPPLITSAQAQSVYASEADLLKVALFGKTASQWREATPHLEGNMRDHAGLEQLVVLSNLESINAVFIHQGLAAANRLKQLNAIAISQMRSLVGIKSIQKLKK